MAKKLEEKVVQNELMLVASYVKWAETNPAPMTEFASEYSATPRTAAGQKAVSSAAKEAQANRESCIDGPCMLI